MPAKVNASSDDREDAREMQPLGRKVSRERRQQRDGDLHRRIIEMPLHPAHDEANENSEGDATERHDNKAPRGRAERELAGYERGDGKSQSDQRGSVVDQAFAF